MEDQSLKPIRCKAAVCRISGEPLTIEIVVDPPKAYEIRIKITCTSLRHTDITFWHVKEDFAIPPVFPRILGHEAYGVVECVGEHVEGFAVGDAVVPTFLGQCSTCSSCASDESNMCTTVPFTIGPGMRRDGTTRFRDSKGSPLHDFLAVSSFSQYTVIDMNQVVKVDPAVPPKLACLLDRLRRRHRGRSCMEVGQGGTWNSVAIFGLGSIGLSVAQGAKMCGASKAIGVDLNPAKQEVGKKFGVTDFINPSQLGNRSVSENIHKDSIVSKSNECANDLQLGLMKNRK